jgi:hypothetical protein
MLITFESSAGVSFRMHSRMADKRGWFRTRIHNESVSDELDTKSLFASDGGWELHRHEYDYWRKQVLSPEEIASGESPALPSQNKKAAFAPEGRLILDSNLTLYPGEGGVGGVSPLPWPLSALIARQRVAIR